MLKRFLAIIFVLAMALPVRAAEPLKPYRVLIVISDQWKDPRSFLVSGDGEFQTLVTMFKSWGIPFDILRLDQTLMDPSHFADFAGKARYGAILWDVPGDVSVADQALVTDAVEKLHISLIAIGDRVKQPAIQRLLGIAYKGDFMNSAHQIAKGDSFVLRGLGPDLRQQGPDIIAMKRVQADATGAKVLAEAGGMAEITEREESVLALASPLWGELHETRHMSHGAFEVSSARVETTFGLKPTPLDQVFREAIGDPQQG